MVFYLVLDILWFVVCVVGVIITLILWLIFLVIRKILEEKCHVAHDGVCHCSGDTDVPIKSE